MKRETTSMVSDTMRYASPRIRLSILSSSELSLTTYAESFDRLLQVVAVQARLGKAPVAFTVSFSTISPPHIYPSSRD